MTKGGKIQDINVQPDSSPFVQEVNQDTAISRDNFQVNYTSFVLKQMRIDLPKILIY